VVEEVDDDEEEEDDDDDDAACCCSTELGIGIGVEGAGDSGAGITGGTSPSGDSDGLRSRCPGRAEPRKNERLLYTTTHRPHQAPSIKRHHNRASRHRGLVLERAQQESLSLGKRRVHCMQLTRQRRTYVTDEDMGGAAAACCCCSSVRLALLGSASIVITGVGASGPDACLAPTGTAEVAAVGGDGVGDVVLGEFDSVELGRLESAAVTVAGAAGAGTAGAGLEGGGTLVGNGGAGIDSSAAEVLAASCSSASFSRSSDTILLWSSSALASSSAMRILASSRARCLRSSSRTCALISSNLVYATNDHRDRLR